MTNCLDAHIDHLHILQIPYTELNYHTTYNCNHLLYYNSHYHDLYTLFHCNRQT